MRMPSFFISSMSIETVLVTKCAQGDRESREEFILKYARLIHKYIASCARIRGVAVSAHAEDIFQEFICYLFEDSGRKLLSFQGRNGCTFASWLRQVTIHYAMRYLGRIQAPLSLDSSDFPAELLTNDDGSSVINDLQAGERVLRLKECIEMLDTDGKYFIEMHINRGVRLEEMRGHLGLTRSAVDVYKSRLIGRLRECFKRKGFFVA